MQYELKGGSFPVVICQLQNGEAMKTEAGSMVWMSDTMEMSTNAGGGLGGMFHVRFRVRICFKTSIALMAMV